MPKRVPDEEELCVQFAYTYYGSAVLIVSPNMKACTANH
jgi:hypothetical protein